MGIDHRWLVPALLLVALAPFAAAIAQEEVSAPEPESGAVVCAPSAVRGSGMECLVEGPSAYLKELARAGFSLPPSPLPASKPDRALSDLPYRYFHVISDEPVSIGSSPGASGGDSLFPGFVYVGYVDRLDTGSGIYYLTQSGGWVPGKGERVGEIPTFQGLEFRSTPHNSFGWTFEDIPVVATPGYGGAETGRRLAPFRVIQIYATQQVDNADWNQIGLGQWVEARKVAQVTVNKDSPEGSGSAARWIEVNLAEQTLAVYQDHRLVFATMIASGVEPFWTRPGVFQIGKKIESETMRNNDPSDFYYLDNVPWTMYFDGPRALHGAYWRTRFGYPQSHGCVNLSVGDAQWIYNWAQEGDWVYVHDPTGMTPTDPTLYTGGAY
jgi:lipoprotein-anchoring transpeptidase ErfK/SrfK